MRLHGATKPLLCRAFSTTLRKAAKEWFNNLRQGLIFLFRDLTYAFLLVHYRRKRKTNLACLLTISQKKGTKLRDFIHRFNTKWLKVRNCKDDVEMAAFTKGLKSNRNDELVRSLYLNPPKDFNAPMSRVKVYMLTDETLDSFEEDETSLPPKHHTKAKGGEPSNK